MKKILSILVAIVAVALVCSSFTFDVSNGRPSVDVREVNVSGHKYVVATSFNASKQGGVAIVHSEGCYCRNKGN